MRCDSPWAHHLALFTLLEIMECASAGRIEAGYFAGNRDSKAALHRQPRRLDRPVQLQQLQAVAENLQGIRTKFGQHLHENEWLMAIKQRMLVPGGTSPLTCLPIIFWQQLPHEQHLADLNKWIATLTPLMRPSPCCSPFCEATPAAVDCVAVNGDYQHDSLAQNIHMLTIELEKNEHALPEVSANKYFTHIRF